MSRRDAAAARASARRVRRPASTGAPLDRAVSVSGRRPPPTAEARSPGYQITPYIGTNAQAADADRLPRDELHGRRAHERHRLHVQGRRRSTPPAPAPTPPPRPVITPQPAPPPGPPTTSSATAGDASAILNWTPPTPTAAARSSATGSRRTSARAAQTPINTGSTATTYTVTGLDQRHDLHLHGRSRINGSGCGPESAPSNPVTPAPPTVPGAPTGVTGAPRDRRRRAHVDRSVLGRRQRDHELPDHAVHRREGADAGQHGLDRDRASPSPA